MRNTVNENRNPINRSDKNPFGVQRDPLEYYKPSYLSPTRMSSYSYQFSLAVKTEGESFLNIGNANNLLNYLLSKQNKYVVDLDLDIRTVPTVNAILPLLPFADDSFDAVLCFQMLEHLPFSMLPDCLKEFKRIAKRSIVLSLPDMSLSKSERLKYKIYKAIKHPTEWRNYKPSNINKEHFWEIGFGDISLKSLISVFEMERLTVTSHFRNKLNPYHHFFVLQIQ